MPGRLRRAGERQIADGTLVIRQATPTERAAWPTPPALAAARAPSAIRGNLFAAIAQVLEQCGAPLSVGKVDRALRDLPDRLRFSAAALRETLAAIIADPASGIRHVPGRGFTVSG
jgi:hypothetical protein